eukprot:9447892-Pyramimonas_sp.AAC.1
MVMRAADLSSLVAAAACAAAPPARANGERSPIQPTAWPRAPFARENSKPSAFRPAGPWAARGRDGPGCLYISSGSST